MALRIILILIFPLLYLNNRPQKITLHLIGDSTCAQKEENKRPETGWGEKFEQFFDDKVEVKNYAKNGRSSRTFIEEQLWDSVFHNLKIGDYVFIQFGHNDEVPEKTSYTTPEDFQANLRRFIEESRARGAYPILMTPMCRRRFDKDGNFYDTHGRYATLTRTVAREAGVTLIDMHAISMAILVQYGETESAKLFLNCAIGDCPNYPKGIEDNTHLNDNGAFVMARAVAKAISDQGIALKSRLVIKIFKENSN